GNDTFDMSAYTTNVATTLTSAAATGFNGTSTAASSFAAIDVIKAGSGAGNTLNGLASGTWNLGATQTYLSGSGTLTFSGFQNLQGGSGIDTFNVLVSTSANLYGNNCNDSSVFANGALPLRIALPVSGNDTLDISAYTTNVATTLTAAAATGFSGTST